MGYEALEPGVQVAVKAALQSVQQNPAGVDGWNELALTYHGNDLFAEARTCYEAILLLDPSRSSAWYRLALVLAESGRNAEAIIALDQARTASPGYAPSSWQAGYILLEEGDLPGAAERFELALKAKPGDPASRVGLARVALASGRPEVASSILEPLRTEISNQYLDFLLAQSYRRQGRVDEAAALLAAGISDPPQFEDPWMDAVREHGASYEARVLAIDRLLSMGADRDALSASRAALETYPDDVALLNRVSLAQSNLGQRDQAVRTLKRTLRTHEDSAVTHLNLSIQYQAMNDLAKARRHAARSVELNPTIPGTHMQLGRLHMQDDQVFPAAVSLDRAFQLGEQGTDERLLYANILTRVGRFDESVEQYGILLERKPDFGSALAGLIDVHIVRGDLQGAAAAANRAIANAPDDPMVQKLVRSLQDRIKSSQGSRP